LKLPAPQTLAPGLGAPEAPRAAQRVLLRLPNWLGDVVMAAPTVAAIARALPQARLTAQVIKPFVPLAALLPGVSEALPAGKDRGLSDLWASRRTVREARYDLAVVFPRGVRAALAPRLAQIPTRVGFGGRGKGLLLTHGVSGWKPLRSQHRSLFYGALALPFGEAPHEPWALTPPPAALAAADALLARLGCRSERPLVALEPGARYGPAKCWPPERFGELARALLAEGCDVVTVGTAATLSVEEQVARIAGAGLRRAAGKTEDLGQLIGLLARARLLVTNDTGPMHLAAALGTPVLALFGATDPRVSAPRGPGLSRLVMDPEPCSPCFLRDCPIPGHPCLTKIGTARVLREAREMLEGGSGSLRG
jgi:heptosyltransferase-2